MKKLIYLLILVSIIVIPLAAQTGQGSVIRGQSLNGQTGLYSLPTGRIGWEDSADFAIDLGYRAIINESGNTHIPAMSLSLFKLIELSAAFDIQPDKSAEYNNDDLLFGFKIKLPVGATAIALGTSIQLINFNEERGNYNAYQPYMAITYPGAFFTMPAETTLFVGKTFFESNNNSDIDFGMGFDLVLLPDVFNGLIHLIMDFANFSYSNNAWPNWGNSGSSASWRGIFNAGFRFDFSKIPALSKYKFILDIAFNDILDDGSRSFTIGGVIGIPVL